MIADKKASEAKIIADKKALALKALKIKQDKAKAHAKANPVDKNKWCSRWASNGSCKNNPGYMLHSCAKSCQNAEELIRMKAVKEAKAKALAAKKHAAALKAKALKAK